MPLNKETKPNHKLNKQSLVTQTNNIYSFWLSLQYRKYKKKTFHILWGDNVYEITWQYFKFCKERLKVQWTLWKVANSVNIMNLVMKQPNRLQCLVQSCTMQCKLSRQDNSVKRSVEYKMFKKQHVMSKIIL